MLTRPARKAGRLYSLIPRNSSIDEVNSDSAASRIWLVDVNSKRRRRFPVFPDLPCVRIRKRQIQGDRYGIQSAEITRFLIKSRLFPTYKPFIKIILGT